MTLRILAAGQRRSGSTWQYNVLRELALNSGGSVYGAWTKDYHPERPEDVHIIKAHDPEQVGELSFDMVFTSYRDLRDVAASLLRMQWCKFDTRSQVTRMFDGYVANLSAWEKRSICVMRYESMMADRVGEIRRMAKTMGVALTSAQVQEIGRKISNISQPEGAPTGSVTSNDPDSQLHPGHIGTNTPPLAQKCRLLIEYEYGKWLKDRQYKLGWAARAMLMLHP